MLDYLIKGGTIVDGSDGDAVRGDVGIRGEHIAVVGEVDEAAHRTIDATGLVIAPGFIDPHTHYDAQLYWDGYATPSSWHGVTSVVGGNCGFTLAPLKARDADYTRRMMAKVEGMPLEALENGVDWSWEDFGQYLDGLEGRIGVNAGFLVGHCALRRYVLGADAMERPSNPTELDEIERLLRHSLAAGGLGFSTSRSSTHNDGDGRPVPSRAASEEEVLRLCRVVGEFPGTSLEAIVEGCLQGFIDQEVELLAGMSAEANRPLNWNVLTIAAGEDERTAGQLRPSRRARELGGRVVALTMPVFADNNMSLGSFCALWLIPGWQEILSLPFEEKTDKLRDPVVRDEMARSAKGTVFERLADFSNYRIGDTVAAGNKRYENRLTSEIAAEMGLDPAEALIDIAAADGYRTVLWPFARCRHRRRLDGAAGPVGPARRAARGIRRRRPPGPHARLALPNPVPGRHVARTPAGVARASHPPHDRCSGPPVRPHRTRPPRSGGLGRCGRLRPRDDRQRSAPEGA
jgi:N-acyl-D-aspartate/D-glutamate deacylase